ncbi:hypothetical protein BGZ70_004502 [Mortierella alpina]|uniref:Uncharacterized protein n=1 Tax=Mortierella alpina TaxID=64518 RepID=A0A9P6ITW1_MORAP|nr:hypothetical protein BGZ70_004502 [Mortierella alpina]
MTPEEVERYRACFEDEFSNFKIVLSKDRKDMLVPFSGEGGAQAILDAVTLANALYDVPSTSVPDLMAAFKSYYDDRYPIALDAIEFSKSLAGVFNCQGWVGDLIRKIALGNTPAFVMRKLDDKLNDKRPQAIFLDFAPVPGLVKPRAQVRSKRQRGEGPLASMTGLQNLASVPETL